MNITITANDGKEFKGTDYESLAKEVNAYETDLVLKKKREEADKKVRESKLKSIEIGINKIKALIDEYEKETGRKVVYICNHSTGKIELTDTQNTLDFAYEDITDKLRRYGLI